jgi:hypothetical protein
LKTKMIKSYFNGSIGVWQGVAMDFLKFLGPLCPLPNPSTPCLKAVLGVAYRVGSRLLTP